MKLRLAIGVSLTDIEGKSVLFSVRTGDSYGLNETAAEMIRLALTTDTEKAAEELARAYEAPVEELRDDLQELIKELARLKFVQVAANDS